jgi:hypothetical protein
LYEPFDLYERKTPKIMEKDDLIQGPLVFVCFFNEPTYESHFRNKYVKYFNHSYSTVTLSNDEVLMLKDSSGNPLELVEYDGYCLARRAIENGEIPDSRTNIPNIIKMKVRTDDVFLIAYPKAGK